MHELSRYAQELLDRYKQYLEDLRVADTSLESARENLNSILNEAIAEVLSDNPRMAKDKAKTIAENDLASDAVYSDAKDMVAFHTDKCEGAKIAVDVIVATLQTYRAEQYALSGPHLNDK